MTLPELKLKINNNERISLPLLFINEDNTDYLIKTYLSAISKNNKLTIKEIKTINEMLDSENSMFKDDEYLYVYHVEKDTDVNLASVADYNLIAIVNKDIAADGFDKITFPKLEGWQIEDYVKTTLPGLTNLEIEWLCKNAKFDINRLDNEASKINIFDKKDQPTIFKEINDDNGYSDLNELTIFNLTTAITTKDICGIKKVVRDLTNIDVEGTGLVTLLLKNFLLVLNIQTNSRATAASLNISEKQFRYLQYNQCNRYSTDDLVKIYNFLTSIDYRLKSGLLDMSNNDLTNYIIANILE